MRGQRLGRLQPALLLGGCALVCLLIVVVALRAFELYAAQLRGDFGAEQHTAVALRRELLVAAFDRFGTDVSIFARNPSVLAALQQSAAPGAKEPTLLAQLVAETSAERGYSEIILVDKAMRPVLPADPAPGPDDAAALRQAMEARGVIFVAQLPDPDRPASIKGAIAFAHPVFAGGQPSGEILGAVLLRANGLRMLEGFLTPWPGARPSLRLALVRRVREQAYCLGLSAAGLDAPLEGSLRPLTDVNDLAVQATATAAPAFTARDRAGAEVIGSAAQIGPSPWYLVGAVDAAELQTPLRNLGLVVGGGAALLMLMVGLGGALLRRADMRRAQEAQAALAARQSALIRFTADAYLRLTPDLRIVDVNRAAEQMTGYAAAELTSMTIHDLKLPGYPGDDALDETTARMLRDGATRFRSHWRRRDDGVIDIDGSVTFVREGETSSGLIIARDVTAERAMQRRLERLNNLHRFLQHVHHASRDFTDPIAFLRDIVHGASFDSNIALVWTAWVDREAGRVRPVGATGGALEMLKDLVFTIEEGLSTSEGIGRIVREKRGISTDSFLDNPRLALWYDVARRVGVQSGICEPLLVDGEVVGTIAFLSRLKDYFDTDVLALVHDMAATVSATLQAASTAAAAQQATAELNRRERIFNAIVEQAGESIALFDAETGAVIEFNNSACNTLGYTPEEFAGLSTFDIAVLPEREKALHLMSKVTSGTSFETQGCRRDGGKFDVHVTISPVRLNGRLCISAIWNDISVEKARERELVHYRERLEELVQARTAELAAIAAQLRESEERYAFAAEATSDGIWDWNVVSGEVTCNAAFWAMLGHMAHPLHSNINTVFDLFDDAGAATAMREQVIDGTEPSFEAELRLRCADGSYRWVLSRGKVVLRDADGRALRIVGTHTDLTRRKEIEDALRRAKEAAESANRAKSSFLAIMSHEIRTPLNGVIGMAEMLASERLSEDQAGMVATIHESGLNLRSLIDDILDFSKIEAERLELAPEPTWLPGLIDGVCNALAPLCVEHRIDLTAFIAPTVPEAIMVDAARLRQMLFNVAGNAVKFSGLKAGRRGRVQMRVALDAAGRLQLQVIDDGIGMSPETQARLFTPFTQGESSTTRRFGGTGLGLVITRRLLDLMGGTIAVRSSLGAGSCFTMALPLAPLPRDAETAQPDLAGLTCVIIAGGLFAAADLAEYLGSAGAAVRIAGTAAEALAALPAGGAILVQEIGPDDPDPVTEAVPPGLIWVLLQGRQRWQARLLGRDDPPMALGWLRRDALLRAVAFAAGRAAAPVPVPPAPGERLFAAAPSIEAARAAGQLVLVVDDDAVNRKVIGLQLNRLGYACERAANGREALEMWRRGGFALVLTDLSMPELDGFQLAAAIRAEEAGAAPIPILMLSANAMPDDIRRASALGIAHYLTKPIVLADLRAAMGSYLPGQAALPPAPAAPIGLDPAGGQAEFDVGALIALVGDDVAVLDELLGDFAAGAGVQASMLRDAAALLDVDAVQRLAHRLKSSSRSVGALWLGEICAAFEAHAKSGDAAAIAALLPEFERAAAVAMERIAAWRQDAAARAMA